MITDAPVYHVGGAGWCMCDFHCESVGVRCMRAQALQRGMLLCAARQELRSRCCMSSLQKMMTLGRSNRVAAIQFEHALHGLPAGASHAVL